MPIAAMTAMSAIPRDSTDHPITRSRRAGSPDFKSELLAAMGLLLNKRFRAATDTDAFARKFL